MYVVLLEVRTSDYGISKRMRTIEEDKEKAQQAILDAIALFGSSRIDEVHVFEGTEIDVKIDSHTEVTF